MSSGRVHRYVVLDVFSDVPLEGNALAVFTDGAAVPERDMQRLARELNLSETVFVLAPERGGDARVRIFTPTRELPFAGHPVLGTALVVGRERGLDAVTLETTAAIVPVRLAAAGAGDGAGGRAGAGSMEQPVPRWRPCGEDARVLSALGVERSGLPVEVYDNGPVFVYVELEDEAAVAGLEPDMRALGELGPVGVVCFAGSHSRWKVRMFAPGMGVPEDPATGSAAGPLAVHLARHGRIAFGEEIEVRQGEELARPSRLRARALGTARAVERVEVGGAAVLVAEGEFTLG
jgi:trans-2,3-dihydro-3-hydroxyanthranilate isomerase